MVSIVNNIFVNEIEREKIMFKKIQLALIISCVSASSYAYVVETNFSVENKTDVPLAIVIDQPNGQKPIAKALPAHEVTTIKMDNGDHSGLLYQTSAASFTIKDTIQSVKAYAQGRIGYYVGASMGNKYSFLNAVSAAEGLTLDTNYSCKNGGYGTTFDNKLVIEGTPVKSLDGKEFPANVSCQGIKSSTLSEKNQEYVITCSDDSYSLFHQRFIYVCGHHDCFWSFSYRNGEQKYFPYYFTNSNQLHAELDNRVGKSFCGNW